MHASKHSHSFNVFFFFKILKEKDGEWLKKTPNIDIWFLYAHNTWTCIWYACIHTLIMHMNIINLSLSLSFSAQTYPHIAAEVIHWIAYRFASGSLGASFSWIPRIPSFTLNKYIKIKRRIIIEIKYRGHRGISMFVNWLRCQVIHILPCVALSIAHHAITGPWVSLPDQNSGSLEN